jgi:hypothetical protein
MAADALRLAAAMPMENIQRTSFGNARGALGMGSAEMAGSVSLLKRKQIQHCS